MYGKELRLVGIKKNPDPACIGRPPLCFRDAAHLYICMDSVCSSACLLKDNPASPLDSALHFSLWYSSECLVFKPLLSPESIISAYPCVKPRMLSSAPNLSCVIVEISAYSCVNPACWAVHPISHAWLLKSLRIHVWTLRVEQCTQLSYVGSSGYRWIPPAC